MGVRMSKRQSHSSSFGGIVKEMPDALIFAAISMYCLSVIRVSQKVSCSVMLLSLSPRAIYTSGQSSTSAGLTATAVKDEFGEGRWTLEAGALVLADMGVCAVDEMDKMQKEDRSALHEAMEQQSISVAKAGITATLKSRCALLGAANPKYGRFDMYGDISDQINMPPSLLSRFDLIFIMTDQPEQKRDLAIAEHILKSHGIGELIAQHRKTPIPGITDEYIQQQLKPVMPDIDPPLFRKYVAYQNDPVSPCFPLRQKMHSSVITSNSEGSLNRISLYRSLPDSLKRLSGLRRRVHAYGSLIPSNNTMQNV